MNDEARSGSSLTGEQLDWLEDHEAKLYFGGGKKIGLEYTRQKDGLRIQISGWTLEEIMSKPCREARC